MWYHYKIIKEISLHSRVKLIRPPRRNQVISMWHKLLIINSSSKSYYLWPIQWYNLNFQSIIPYYKGISLNFKMMYLRVSTLQTVFCGVFGVSILSYARLTSAGAIKSSNLWGAVLLSIQHFLISTIRFLDIIHFLISRNAFLDIKNSISWYQEIIHISWYQKIEFLISRNHFLVSRNRFLDINKCILRRRFTIYSVFLDIKYLISWYQETISIILF